MTLSRMVGVLVMMICWAGVSLGQQTDRHVVLITIDGFPASLLHDPQTPIPTIRKLAAEGVMGEGMRPVNPSITWPNHTSLITGVRPAKHSVLFNGVVVRGEAGTPARVDPRKTRKELIAAETIFDVLHKAGLRTAGINWPCTREDEAVHQNFPDVPENLDHTTPALRKALVEKGVLPNETDASFRRMSSPQRDHVWMEAACHVIKTHRPHFMAWHILNTDGVHHKYGPKNMASQTALAQADAQVAQFLRALDETGIREKTTILIVSDHGFATASDLIQPNLALKKAGLLKADLLKIVSAKAHSISEGGTAMVYFTDPSSKKQDIATARKVLSEMEGVEEVIAGKRLLELGYPDPAKNPQMADLVLSAAPGFAFANSTMGEAETIPVKFNVHSLGYHGFLSEKPQMLTAFVASGPGIRKGAKQAAFDNIDIAPTVAKLLGVKLEGAEGKALEGVLRE